MPSLYEIMLPTLQAISEQGGNQDARLFSKHVLDLIDAQAPANKCLSSVRVKLADAISAITDKRDHQRFAAALNAYYEGVAYVSMKDRGLNVVTVPEESEKTPDFLTTGTPSVGFELKTLDVHRPTETKEAAMDGGFEARYEALETARAMAAESPQGRGIGFATSETAPHGNSAGLHDAVVQTIRKIRGNIKQGQYQGQPTVLIVSLVRLGIDDSDEQLRKWQDVDTDFGGQANGLLFTIAAHEVGSPFNGYDPARSPGPVDLGPLNENGILRDHPFIAGIIFMKTVLHEIDNPAAAKGGTHFYGIWNADWNAAALGFTQEQEREAKQQFQILCDAWNDTADARGRNMYA